MIRLVLLLLGTNPLRAHWWVFVLLSVVLPGLGLTFIADLFDDLISVTIDIIGVVMVTEGARRLLVLAYPLLFVWGGLSVGIYTVMMAGVGSRFQGGDLVSAYAVMSVAWGIGAFIGPSSAGGAMELSTHGLPYFTAAACVAFTVLAVVKRR
jgi:hypothetical protein